jgi:hypothetical protein
MRHSISSRLHLLVGRVKSLVRSENKAGRPSRRRSLQLEELSARVLPSANPVVEVHVPVGHAATHMAQPPLAGTGQGSYSRPAVQSGAGITYTLSGTAKFAGLGDVTVAGSVRSVGFIAEGNASGELTFTNAKGSVTVQLEGPRQAGFSALPQQFKFSVIGGTGQYQHLSSHGTIDLVLTATPGNPLTGTFTLKS